MPSPALAEFVTDSVLKGHLSAGNWKQALKTIDKKLKKSPNDTSLLVCVPIRYHLLYAHQR